MGKGEEGEGKGTAADRDGNDFGAFAALYTYITYYIYCCKFHYARACLNTIYNHMQYKEPSE